MISVRRARELVLENLPELRGEEVRLQDAPGRVLAVAIKADHDVPPFRRSAMDGYAVRSADIGQVPTQLERVGEVRAGQAYTGLLASGEALAIYTGAPVPEGADAVQIVEQTRRVSADIVEILSAVRPGENITPAGHETAAGSTLLNPGRVLGATEMAILATFGRSVVPVWARPSIALISTGDELVEADETPSFGQIRNSNAWSVSAQLAELGIRAAYLGIARDDPDQLCSLIRKGLEYDVLILTGGVSMGEFDLVKAAFRDFGLHMHFDKVAMRPGKPTVFATRGARLVFGLPGNPVSAFVACEILVRPALGRMCGLPSPELASVRGRLLRDVRQAPGRTAFLPAWVTSGPESWTIDPLPWKGSGDIIGFSRCNAMLVFPGERDHMGQDETAEALLLPDYFKRQRG